MCLCIVFILSVIHTLLLLFRCQVRKAEVLTNECVVFDCIHVFSDRSLILAVLNQSTKRAALPTLLFPSHLAPGIASPLPQRNYRTSVLFEQNMLVFAFTETASVRNLH